MSLLLVLKNNSSISPFDFYQLEKAIACSFIAAQLFIFT
jgi:hypothetical protein